MDQPDSPSGLSAAAAVEAAVYRHNILTVSPQTVKWLTYSVERLAVFAETADLGAISTATIFNWHTQLLGNVSPTTANNYLRGVRVVYRRLVNQGRLSTDPTAPIPFAPQRPRTPEAVTELTYRKLVSAASTRDRAIIGLLWGTGCRIGEIATMSIDCLETWSKDETPCIAVAVLGKHHRRLSNNRAIRYVYASDSEAQSVIDWLAIRPVATSRAVFTSKDGRAPISSNTIRSALRLTAQKSGVTACHNAHAFRHAFAYRKRCEGYPLEWISEWLGHSDPAFTARMYGDKTEREIRNRFFDLPPNRRPAA